MKKVSRKVPVRRLAEELTVVRGGIRSQIIDIGAVAPAEDDSDIRAQIIEIG
jgi:hypothetical protein